MTNSESKSVNLQNVPGISATKYHKPNLAKFYTSDVRENARELV